MDVRRYHPPSGYSENNSIICGDDDQDKLESILPQLQPKFFRYSKKKKINSKFSAQFHFPPLSLCNNPSSVRASLPSPTATMEIDKPASKYSASSLLSAASMPNEGHPLPSWINCKGSNKHRSQLFYEHWLQSPENVESQNNNNNPYFTKLSYNSSSSSSFSLSSSNEPDSNWWKKDKSLFSFFGK